MLYRFRINETDFRVESADLYQDEFTVRASRSNYTVRFTDAAATTILHDASHKFAFVDAGACGNYTPASDWHLFDVNENFKSLEGLQHILQCLRDYGSHGYPRAAGLPWVVGGGVLQDVVGMAMAVYRRGLPWQYVPTTLLAMADSCIGTKVNLNYGDAKNQLGLFAGPAEILICPDFLQTLDPQAIQSGMGEVLKLHVLGGPQMLTRYQEHQHSYERMIRSSLQIKKAVIEHDEFDRQHRQALNYGHTFGHAIESLSDYAIPHGTAVVFGMLLVNALAYRLGRYLQADRRLIESLAKPLLSPAMVAEFARLDFMAIGDLLRQDKKAAGKTLRLVVLERLGSASLLDLELTPELLTAITTEAGELLARLA